MMHVADLKSRRASHSILRNSHQQIETEILLELNDEAKTIVQEIAAAINTAVERSSDVAEAIDRLRSTGYDMELTLRLEIGLREHTARAANDELASDEDNAPDSSFDLTDEDRRTLRRMKISLE